MSQNNCLRLTISVQFLIDVVDGELKWCAEVCLRMVVKGCFPPINLLSRFCSEPTFVECEGTVEAVTSRGRLDKNSYFSSSVTGSSRTMTDYALDSGVYATLNRAVWYAPMLRFFIVPRCYKVISSKNMHCHARR